MARGTTPFAQAFGSLTAYKNAYQPLSTILNQASPRTADTGQVNWATISSEPTVIRDYEIFALGGPLQATAPIYLRVDYVGGATYANSGVNITVGTTTDGAGNLGGLVVPLLKLQQHTLPAASSQTAWAASDRESYFTFLYALDTAATGADGVGMFVIERSRDITGAPTGGGFHCWRWYANSAAVTYYAAGWQKTFGAISQVPNADYNFNVWGPDMFNSTTYFSDNTAYALPAYTYTPGVLGGASKALLFGVPADFPRGQALTLTHYGEQQTFVTLGDAFANTVPVLNNSGAPTTKPMMPMIRWD